MLWPAEVDLAQTPAAHCQAWPWARGGRRVRATA